LTVAQIVSKAPSLAGTAPASPSWSPSGEVLAFSWNDRALPAREIWLVDRDGTGPRRLTHASEQAGGAMSEFVWMRDGRSIVYLAGGDLYRVAAGGGTPERLTTSGGEKGALAISPDGRLISFLSQGDLWLLPAAGGSEEQATQVGKKPIGAIPLGNYHRPDVEIGGADWGESTRYAFSPDGSTVALHYVDRTKVRQFPIPYYLTDDAILNRLRRGAPGDVNETRTVGLLDIKSRALKLLPLPNSSGWRVIGFGWSPRGELMIDRESDDSVDRSIVLTDAQGSAPREIWRDHGEQRIYNDVASTWGPDGKSIVITGDLDDRYRLYSIPVSNLTEKQASGFGPRASGTADLAPAPLTPGPSDVDGPAIPGGASLYFVSSAPRPSERQVWRIPGNGAGPVKVTSRPGIHAPFPSPDGKSLAILSSDDVTPPELYLLDANGGNERRITHSPPEDFARYPWVKGRYVQFKSTSAGVDLHARILEPSNLDRRLRYPVIFGPTYTNRVRNRWDARWSLLEQLLVQHGYVLVQLDSRGSTGYGRAFREKFLFDWGSGDLDDYADAVGYMKSLPFVDPARIGIFGSSYGGLVTVFALFKKPGLFAAGVAGAPATDPRYFGSDDVAVARRPQSHPEVFSKGRAALYAKNLRDHLMIIHGMADDVVPFQTSVQLAEELIKQRKEFDLVLAPAATHRWATRPDDAVYLFNKLIGHFDRYLGPGPRASDQAGIPSSRQ
jgi:dipeptidyl-peptidase-4